MAYLYIRKVHFYGNLPLIHEPFSKAKYPSFAEDGFISTLKPLSWTVIPYSVETVRGRFKCATHIHSNGQKTKDKRHLELKSIGICWRQETERHFSGSVPYSGCFPLFFFSFPLFFFSFFLYSGGCFVSNRWACAALT